MHADSAYVMGQGHRVCQDYARSGLECMHPFNFGYAIVSDGCSGSPDTDVGARLLALRMERALKGWDCIDAERMADWVRSMLRNEFYGLNPMAFDATLVTATAFVDPGHTSIITATVMGDGVFAVQRPGEDVRIWTVDVPDGHPRYLNYLNDDRRRSAVEMGDPWQVYGPSGVELETHFVEAFVHQEKDVPAGTVVAVFSDGVRSFVDADRQPVPVDQVVGELMSFKGMMGVFVQRRMQGFLRAAAQRGWRHDDDLAMAAVHVGEP